MVTVREFSVAELDRIARPGASVPVLFWLLPLGELEHQTHERLRALFCNEYAQSHGIGLPADLRPPAALSFCRDLGVLLVREDQLPRRRPEPRHGRHDEQRSVPARELQSELRKALSAQRSRRPSFLVLSSAFPEPGWGVWLQPLDEQAEWGERLLSALCGLWDHVGRRVEAAQPALDTSEDKRESETLVHNLEAQLTALERGLSHKEWPKARSALGYLTKPLQNAIATPALSAVLFDGSPASADDFLAGIPNIHWQVAFRLLSGARLDDRSFEAMLAQFAGDEAERVRAAPLEWANRLAERLVTEVAPKTHHLLVLEVGIPKADHWLKAERERQRKLNDDWQAARQKAMEEMVTSTAARLAACRKAGPQLLVEIERGAGGFGFRAISMAEDRPRMVGWKLIVAGASLHGSDLIPVVQDALPAQHRLNGAPDEPLGGQHFTDYVHYLARHSPGQSPRNITLNVLARLLSARELRRVTACFGGSGMPPETGQRKLAEACLQATGWPAPAEAQTVLPLRDHLLPRELGAEVADVSGPELRRSAESFAKDFLFVTVDQMPGGPSRAGEVLRGQGVNLRYGVAKGLGMLTLGEAQRWIKALGSVQFSNKLTAVQQLCQGLDGLNEMTKPWVHHWNETRVEELLKHHEAVPCDLRSLLNKEAPELVRSLLHAAAKLIVEMPWHVTLQSLTVVGECQVATVTGWSHSYAGSSNKREILLWHRQEIPEDCVVWNEGGLNPVMANCRFFSPFLE